MTQPVTIQVDTESFTKLAHPIGWIKTYEIMEPDVSQLERDISDEHQALGFFTACLGAFVPFLVSLLTLPDNTAARTAEIYAAATFVTGFNALWFGLTWWKRRGSALRFTKKLQERPSVPMKFSTASRPS